MTWRKAGICRNGQFKETTNIGETALILSDEGFNTKPPSLIDREYFTELLARRTTSLPVPRNIPVGDRVVPF